MSFVKSRISSLVHRMWTEEWTDYEGGRMTKEFFPEPDNTSSTALLALTRHVLSQCVAFITGHNELRYHRSLREAGLSSSCRLCFQDRETASHLLTECPRLSITRFDIFGTHHPVLPLWELSVRQFACFVRSPVIWSSLTDTDFNYLNPSCDEWSLDDPPTSDSVSYTHLTLPTKA